MDVNATGSMEQTQMRKMDGSGGGKGQGGGMQEIMQSLSTEDQDTMKTQMSSMSMEDKMAKMSEMKAVDSTSLTNEEYAQMLLDILADEDATKEEGTNVLSVYA